MKQHSRMRYLNVAALLLLFGYSAAAMAASASFEETYASNNNVIVDVSNQRGRVIVKGQDVDQVTVKAKIKIDKRYAKTYPQRAARVLREIINSPPIESIDNQIVVKALEKHSHKRYAIVNYVVTVPSEATVNVQSVSGDIRVSGVSGDVKATSETGEVSIDGSAERLSAQAGR